MTASTQQTEKNLLVELPRTMLIGIRKRGTIWSSNAQMLELALAAPQTVGYLS